MSRIINSPDYGAVSPIELKVFRDLDKLLKKQERKKKRGNDNVSKKETGDC